VAAAVALGSVEGIRQSPGLELFGVALPFCLGEDLFDFGAADGLKTRVTRRSIADCSHTKSLVEALQVVLVSYQRGDDERIKAAAKRQKAKGAKTYHKRFGM